jgi:hypothetical protein
VPHLAGLRLIVVITGKCPGQLLGSTEDEVHSTIRTTFGFLPGSQVLVDTVERCGKLSSRAEILHSNLRVVVHPPNLSAIFPTAGGAAHHMRLNPSSDYFTTDGQPL